MIRAAQDICDSVVNEPHRWKLSYCTWARDDGLEIWRANVPIFNTHIYQPNQMGLGLLGAWAVWRQFKRWQRDMPLEGYLHPQGTRP